MNFILQLCVLFGKMSILALCPFLIKLSFLLSVKDSLWLWVLDPHEVQFVSMPLLPGKCTSASLIKSLVLEDFTF